MPDAHVAVSRSFEDMLADPHEQFDPRSELLASIAAYAAAPPAAAGIQPPRPAAHYAWLYAPSSTTGTNGDA